MPTLPHMTGPSGGVVGLAGHVDRVGHEGRRRQVVVDRGEEDLRVAGALGDEARAARAVVVVLVEAVDVGPRADVQAGAGVEDVEPDPLLNFIITPGWT